MINKTSFTPEEWRTLQFAPLRAFYLVAGADSKVDVKETEEMIKTLNEAAFFIEPLVREVLFSIVSDFNNILAKLQTEKRNFLDGLRDVADILDKKATPEVAKNFKTALLHIAHKIAEASGGGLFGMGDKVSDSEKAAITGIAVALRAV